jgi:hypothetical protein
MWTIRNWAIKWRNVWNYSLADMNDRILNVKAGVIRHHQSWPQMRTLMSSDTTVRITNRTNKNVSLVSGIYSLCPFLHSDDLTATHTCHFQEIYIFLPLSYYSIYHNVLTLCRLPSYTFQAFYLFYIIHEFLASEG